LKLDFVNAFNTISRDEILHTFQEVLPELYPFILICYNSPSHLCFGEFLISSAKGVQQGDPLGPLLFCVAAQKMANLMKSQLNLWYMDDGSLGGRSTCSLKILRRIGSAFGLLVNEQKCELVTDDLEVVEKFRAIPRVYSRLFFGGGGNWHFPPENFSFSPDNFNENKNKLCVVV